MNGSMEMDPSYEQTQWLPVVESEQAREGHEGDEEIKSEENMNF